MPLFIALLVCMFVCSCKRCYLRYIYIVHIILTFLCAMFRNGISFGAAFGMGPFTHSLLSVFCASAFVVVVGPRCRKNVCICVQVLAQHRAHITQTNKCVFKSQASHFISIILFVNAFCSVFKISRFPFHSGGIEIMAQMAGTFTRFKSMQSRT